MFPKLKNSMLCRILPYAIFGILFFGVFFGLALVNFLSDTQKVIAILVWLIAGLVFLLKNFRIFTGLDVTLTVIHCHNTARKRFTLPYFFTVEQAKRRIARFGGGCEVLSRKPMPEMLRYKSNTPISIYSSGIEKLVASYHVDLLDKDLYHSIVSSADANARVYEGRKKHFLINGAQRTAPLNRITVAFIFAEKIDASFREILFDTVSKDGDSQMENALLPCVIDIEEGYAIFDSLRLPFMGLKYPAKNHAIKLVRKILFKNKFTYKTSHEMILPIKNYDLGMILPIKDDDLEMITQITDYDPEMDLWTYIRLMKEKLNKNGRKILQSLDDKRIVSQNDHLYLRWGDYGVSLKINIDEELKKAEIEGIKKWYYPKASPIPGATIREMKKLIDDYFKELGYEIEYIDDDYE